DVLCRHLALGAREALGFEDAVIGLPAGPDRLRFLRPGLDHVVVAEPTFSARAIGAPRAIVSLDPARDFPEQAALYREHNVKVLVAAPVRAGDESIGVLTARSSRASLFTSDDLEMCQLIADQAALVLRNRALLREREHRADHDQLTDLLTPSALYRAIDEL